MSITSPDPYASLVASLKDGVFPTDALHDLLRDVTCYIRVNHKSLFEDADDIALEAVLDAYRGIEQFRGDSKFFSWLCVIVDRQIAKRAKKLGQVQRWDDVPEAAVEAVAVDSWHQHERENCQLFQWDLDAVLATLTDVQRQVFVMRLQEQYPSKTVAQSLEISDDNVRQILVRTCRLIGQKLKEAGWEHLSGSRVKDVRQTYSTAVVTKATASTESKGEKSMSTKKAQP